MNDNAIVQPRNWRHSQAAAEAHEIALDAIIEARRAVQQTAPNQDDFHPMGPGDFKKAVSDHQACISKLDAVYDLLKQTLETIPKPMG